MFKSIIRNFVGENTWKKLGEARQEFKIRNKNIHMDPLLFEYLNPLLPRVGYYADIGAHDGRSFSNTYHLEKLGWSGVLVEPMLPTYFRLRDMRSKDSNFFANAACVSFAYSDKNLLMSYGDLMSFAPGISTLNASEWRDGAKQFLNRNETVIDTWVPATTLTSIFDHAKSPAQIDFMSIDVEGAESEVLDGIDFRKYSFTYICLETYVPDMILPKLETHGYRSLAYVANNLILQKKS
jgi:FkbM family methyltransferase